MQFPSVSKVARVQSQFVNSFTLIGSIPIPIPTPILSFFTLLGLGIVGLKANRTLWAQNLFLRLGSFLGSIPPCMASWV